MNDSTAPWTLRGGVLDSGEVKYNQWNQLEVVSEKTGTQFDLDHNLRVIVVSDRHIIIADVNPESMQGDKLYTPNTAVTPFERSQDTTGVTDPIAHSSVLKVYPNPAHDQLTVEVTGQGQTWVNIVDIYGRVVKNVYNGVLEDGQNGTFPLNTSDLSSGVYFLHVRGTNGTENIEFQIVR
ncbi:MAG: T9SS type A sorting domain-containing protein [Candidatus Marsarchaeota archaeon]|nr:T9SS type A sorting domain-containing protein [Candidatus Marsarchaeota archaeon]